MRKQSLRTIDVFSLVAGIVGLVADFVGLGGLVLISKTKTSSSPMLWVVLFLLMIYSIALVSFISRKRMFNAFANQIRVISRASKAIESEEERKAMAQFIAFNREHRSRLANYVITIEKGSLSLTLLVGIPLTICFFLAVFYVDGSSSDRVFAVLPGLSSSSSDLIYTLIGGLFYGGIVGCLVSYFVNRLVLNVYVALNADYPDEIDYITSGRSY